MDEAWNWGKMVSPHWLIPAESVYYYLYNWKEHHKILDIGAGVGRHSLLFAKNGYDVTAFDSSLSGLEIIRKRALEQNLHISTVCGDMKAMPFCNSGFDAVLAYHSIYHVAQNELAIVIKEIHRCLKVGGNAYITLLSKDDEHYLAHQKEKISNNVVLKRDGKEGPLVPHYYIDYEEIPELFSSFQILSSQKLIEYIKGHQIVHFNLHLKKI